jgi:hypoxanthine phosphoribosyltransferase
MKLILSKPAVERAMLSMAIQITKLNCIQNKQFALISILKGGLYTGLKLLDFFEIKDEILFGCLGLSSYKDNLISSNKIIKTYPLDINIKLLANKNIFIIDDIFDSGQTLTEATSIIRRTLEEDSIQNSNVYTAVLVKKNKCKDVEKWPNIAGYEMEEDKFIVGCGMGLGEKYRCLPELYELEDKDINLEE